MMIYPVETHNLRRNFGERVALNDVTLSVNEGEIFGLLGPNGGGKTTMFRILSTMLVASAGSARVAGHDVEREPAAVRAAIGVVFQSPSLDPQLTVAENLRWGGNLYGLRGKTLAARMRETAEALRVADRMNDRVAVLSGGLQRRVEIAKSLLPRPRVLLLDEPSTGLDPLARVDLWNILAELRSAGGMTVVLTTHLMDEAERCDRVAILHQGRLCACDTPSVLRAGIGHDVLTLTGRDAESLAGRLREKFGWSAAVLDGAVRVEIPEAHTQVARIVEAFPGEVQTVTAGRPTLEDVFIRLTGERWRAEESVESVRSKKKKR